MSLFEQHPLRQALNDEVHARPPVPLNTPEYVSYLAFLHDVGALALAPAEDEPRIQVIVGNDGGGTIFDGLEVAGVAGNEAMDRVLYTPHTVRLEQLALAYGWEYHRPSTRGALDQLLTSPVCGRQLIEVPLSR